MNEFNNEGKVIVIAEILAKLREQIVFLGRDLKNTTKNDI